MKVLADSVGRVLRFLAAVSLCAIGLIVAADVVLRYLFHAPLGFAFDLILRYLFPASVLLVLLDVEKSGGNIRLDLLSRFLNAGQTRWIAILIDILAGACFSTIAFLYMQLAFKSYLSGEIAFGMINWLIWPTNLIGALGFGALAIYLLARLLRNLLHGQANRIDTRK